MHLKRQMISRTYTGYSIMRDRYMIKLLNLDLLCDEAALVLNKINVYEYCCTQLGKKLHPYNWVLFLHENIYTRKYALIDHFVNWQPIYFFKFFNGNIFSIT